MPNRVLDANLQAGAESAVFNYIVFIKLDFPSGLVCLHNGVGTYSFGGNDYLGVGAFGTISAIEDTTDLVSKPIQLTLSSISGGIIDAIKTDNVFGRDADIYLGVLNDVGQLLGTPDNWYSGHMEIPSLTLGRDDAIQVSLQSRASRLRLRNNKRYTIEDHQTDYPGDLFFEFLSQLMDAQVIWGGEKVRTGFINHDPLGGSDGGGRRRPGGRSGGGSHG
jgi:hypothetical protein